MFLEYIFVFSLVPIVNSILSDKKENFNKNLNFLINFGCTISVLISFIGAFFYIGWICFFVADDVIYIMVLQSIILLCFLAPIRTAQFIMSLSLHTKNLGIISSRISFVLMVMNVVFNYLMIYFLSLGFIGVYVSTGIITIIHLSVNYLVLKKTNQFSFRIISLYKKLNYENSINILKDMLPESIKISSDYIFGFVIISILIFIKNDELLLSYSAIYYLTSFLLIPIVANLRAVTIYISKYSLKEYCKIKSFNKFVFIIFYTFLITFIIINNKIFLNIDVFEPKKYLIIYPWLFFISFLYFFVNIFNCENRGILIGLKKYYQSGFSFVLFLWLIELPMILVGIYLNNYWIFWFAPILNGFFSFLYMEKKIRNYSNF